MTETIRYGGKTYEVSQSSKLPYIIVKLIEPRFTMEDRQVFRATGEEAQEYIDMGTREVLEVLDNRGLL